MKFIQLHIFFAALILSATLPTSYAVCAAQQRQRANAQQVDQFLWDARMFLNSRPSREGLQDFVKKYPCAISLPTCSGRPVFQGQTLAHLLINKGHYCLVKTLVDMGETLGSPSTQEDPKYPGTTAFLALSMKSAAPQKSAIILEIASTVLSKHSFVANQARNTDWMTPMLAAASTHNIPLMERIHQDHPDAYNDCNIKGETVASIGLLGLPKPTTVTILRHVLHAAPHLLTPRLAEWLIESGKVSLLRAACGQIRPPIPNEYITLSYETITDPQIKWLMREYLMSKCPDLNLQEVPLEQGPIERGCAADMPAYHEELSQHMHSPSQQSTAPFTCPQQPNSSKPTRQYNYFISQYAAICAQQQQATSSKSTGISQYAEFRTQRLLSNQAQTPPMTQPAEQPGYLPNRGPQPRPAQEKQCFNQDPPSYAATTGQHNQAPPSYAVTTGQVGKPFETDTKSNAYPTRLPRY